MFGILGDVGGEIVISIISDALNKKIESVKDKKCIESFIKSLRDWMIEFEAQNDETIITNQAFYSYVKYHQVIEEVVDFILQADTNSITEAEFINCLLGRIENSLRESSSRSLSYADSKLISEFLRHLFNSIRTFLLEKVTLQDRGVLYLVCQNHANLKHLEETIKKRFQLQEQMFKQLIETLSKVDKQTESREQVKSKLALWNSSQIKNLGNRYNPDLNISVEIMDALHGASVDQEFQNTFYKKIDDFLIAIREARITELNALSLSIEEYVTKLDIFSLSSNDIDEISKTVNDIKDFLTRKVDECNESLKEKTRFDSDAYQFFSLMGIVIGFYDYLSSITVASASSPYIVLAGDGGTGKSHLIADYIESQKALGHSSLLILGQTVSQGMDILSSIPTLLGCDMLYHDLFDILEAIACDQRSRFLICIDALNEGAGVTYWNSTLGGIVEYLKSYPHIGLLVSVRTQYENRLFENQDKLKNQMQRLEHTGFSTVEYEAINRYFTFFGITIDSPIFPGDEFRNPLFLRLFCTANRNRHISLGSISLPSVYAQYIDAIEQQVSTRCNYNKSLKIVSKIIDAIVSKRIDEHCGSIPLTVNDTLLLIANICKYWNITGDVYSALLVEGVLTQGIMYDGEEYVYVTYERLEDFYLAQRIVEAHSQLNEEQFFTQYSWIVYRPDLLQFFGIILSENEGIELSDVFSPQRITDAQFIREAFLYGLLWRNKDSITRHTLDYINTEILQYDHSFLALVDVIFALSARPNHPLNAHNAFTFFLNPGMPDRDAEFIPVFDELYNNNNSALYHLVEWGLGRPPEQLISDDDAEACATNLSWLLITPNNRLRDRATKAIICILRSHTTALLSLMQRFEGIDDPYLAERIYCIAFGCAVNEEFPDQLKALAEYVYKCIFDKDSVYPNILLRTYAKNILDYACFTGCVEADCFDISKITPPYKSTFPSIPSDEEIKQYKPDYKSESFKEYQWSQIEILNSMKVEYSRSGRPGGYGDFGRYTFQSYFSAWKNLHPMDLKNIAINRIFELGYDAEKHGEYDRHCTDRIVHGDKIGRMERIGKKYQWIALYELAAQVADNYEMTVYTNDIGKSYKEYCKGSFEPNIRNIDPTVLPTHSSCRFPTIATTVEYAIPSGPFEEWLSDFSNTPSFETAVKLQYDSNSFLMLEGDYDWKDAKRIGFRSYELPRKNMWQQIRSYIVKKEDAESIISTLSSVDFMGRWMPECQRSTEMFNKEYYWSDADAYFKNSYYNGLEWVSVDSSQNNRSFSGKMLIPVRQFFSERSGDINCWDADEFSLGWYKPCEEMFVKMQLQYVKGYNSVFIDSSGDLVCFDSSELSDSVSRFYIRHDKLLDFLNSNGYTLVWTSLREKRILTHLLDNRDLPSKAIHESSVFFLKDGSITKASVELFEDKLYY